jgi:hypothetical protein
MQFVITENKLSPKKPQDICFYTFLLTYPCIYTDLCFFEIVLVFNWIMSEGKKFTRFGNQIRISRSSVRGLLSLGTRKLIFASVRSTSITTTETTTTTTETTTTTTTKTIYHLFFGGIWNSRINIYEITNFKPYKS